MRGVIISVLILTLPALTLSALFKVPYAVTVLGVLAWASIGHLVTLDDDEPGGWSNPESTEKFWFQSLIGLALKFVLLCAGFVLIMVYPNLLDIGA